MTDQGSEHWQNPPYGHIDDGGFGLLAGNQDWQGQFIPGGSQLPYQNHGHEYQMQQGNNTLHHQRSQEFMPQHDHSPLQQQQGQEFIVAQDHNHLHQPQGPGFSTQQNSHPPYQNPVNLYQQHGQPYPGQQYRTDSQDASSYPSQPAYRNSPTMGQQYSYNADFNANGLPRGNLGYQSDYHVPPVSSYHQDINASGLPQDGYVTGSPSPHTYAHHHAEPSHLTPPQPAVGNVPQQMQQQQGVMVDYHAQSPQQPQQRYAQPANQRALQPQPMGQIPFPRQQAPSPLAHQGLHGLQDTTGRSSPHFQSQQMVPSAQTTQSRLLPLQPAPDQQNMHAAAVQTAAAPQQRTQSDATAQPSTAAAPVPGGLRVSSRNDNNVSTFGTRYVSFAPAAAIRKAEPSKQKEKQNPIPPDWCSTVADPSQRLSTRFPAQNGQPRTLANEVVADWADAVVKGNKARENLQKDRLTTHLGYPHGQLPDYYANAMTRFKRAKDSKAAKVVADSDVDQDGDSNTTSEGEGPMRVGDRPEEDEAAAAEWDAIGIVDLSINPKTNDARVAVAQYGTLMTGLTAKYKTAKVLFKDSKDKANDEAETTALEKQLERRQEVIYRAVQGANDCGDDDVVTHFGLNQHLISSLVQVLIHASNVKAYNGEFARATLRLLSKVTTIDKEFLMNTLPFDKLRKKFLEKGDDEVKALFKTIVANAKDKTERADTPVRSGVDTPPSRDTNLASKARATSTASTDSKNTMTPSDPAKRKAGSSAVTPRVPSASLVSKRPRDEEADTKVVKKLATGLSTSTTSQSNPKTTSVKATTATPSQNVTFQAKYAGSGLLPGRSRPAAKPAVRTASASSDKTKADVTKSQPTAKTEVKREQPKSGVAKSDVTKARKPIKDEAPPSSKLGIMSLLDEIAKPKKVAVSTPDQELQPERNETPEEKARREKKEERRKLGVRWADDIGQELTDVRVFHKDVGEDEGRATNMIKDARDDRSEGMMLRQGLKEGVKLEEEDDDDLSDRPWFEPSRVDFALVPKEQRDKSFVTRGGNVGFETDQQKCIADRENRELMVVYTTPSDIPFTPKSPSAQHSEDDTIMSDIVQGKILPNQPEFAEIHRRWIEADKYGLDWAKQYALHRANQSTKQGPSGIFNTLPDNTGASNQFQNPASTMSKDDQVFALLNSSKAKNWKDPNPYDPTQPQTQRRFDYVDPELQRAADLIEGVVSSLKDKPFPPTEPPEWVKNDPTRVQEWWHGYNKDKQREEQRARQQEQAMKAFEPAPAVQTQPVAAQPAQATQDHTAAWAAYYAHIQAAQTQGQAPQQNPYAAYVPGGQQAAQQQAPQAQAGGDPNAQLQSVLAALMGTAGQGQQQPAQNAVNPQLQAMLANLGVASSAQPAQTYQNYPANPADPNYIAYMLSVAQRAAQQGGQTQGQQPQPANGNGNNDFGGNSRDRGYDMDYDQPSRQGKGRGGGGNNNKTNHSNSNNTPPHLRGIVREKIGTKACVFWANGTCNKGDKCTFRHD